MRSNRPQVFLEKVVPKICSKYTGEDPCRSVISIKLHCIFSEHLFLRTHLDGCFSLIQRIHQIFSYMYISIHLFFLVVFSIKIFSEKNDKFLAIIQIEQCYDYCEKEVLYHIVSKGFKKAVPTNLASVTSANVRILTAKIF